MKNATFDMNTEGRDFFVGDLHGMYGAFQDELKKVDFDYDIDRVFSVGDLADRGPQSVDCLNLLHAPWFHAVRGNHEDFLLGSHSDHIWYSNGGMWIDAVDYQDLNDIRDLVSRKMHRTMTIDTELGKIGVVHAESAQDWNHNGELTNERNSWARTKIRALDRRPVENIDQVVVGHTVVNQILRLANIIYIDTGAVYGDDRELTMLDVNQVFNGEYKRI